MFTSQKKIKIEKALESIIIENNDKDFFIESNTLDLTKKYTLNNAYILSEFSRLAYVENKEKIKHEVRNYAVEFFYKDGTEAHIATNKHCIVIFFRGTQLTSYEDIKSDLEFSYGVHSGFKKALDLVWNDLYNSLKSKLNYQDRMVFITGHSLGAALASIAASRLKNVVLYTYGSPRVGNKNFVVIPHYRFVNNKDIIPELPPSWFGYKHFGDLYHINKKGLIYNIIYNIMIYNKLSLLTWAIFLFIFNIGKGIRDHNILNYSSRIRKNLHASNEMSKKW